MSPKGLTNRASRLLQFPHSENLLRVIMESAAVGMVLAGPDGRITYANRAYGEIFRCRPEDCIGLSAGDLVVPEDRLLAAEQVRRLIEGEVEQYRAERRYLLRDGSGWFWGLASAALLRHEATGQPHLIVIQVTDIDRQKRAETALAEERETLRVTLESIADGVIAADPEGKVMFMNSVAAQMTGWTTEAALGQPVEDVYRLADESGIPLANPVIDCLFGRRRRQVDEDAVLLKREGGRSDVRSSVSLIEAPGGGFFGAVLVFQDVSRSRALQRELTHTAMHDGLTGLPNRSAFERKLDEMRFQARDDGRVHALCFIDLDRFKPVNDKAGHAAGDALLREVAVTLRGRARRTDFAARIGGDEFAVLLADCDANAARRIAGSIVEAISAIVFQWEGETYRIGASVGVTLVGPDAPDASRLLAEADAACYAAKAKGRNRVEISETWASSPPIGRSGGVTRT